VLALKHRANAAESLQKAAKDCTRPFQVPYRIASVTRLLGVPSIDIRTCTAPPGAAVRGILTLIRSRGAWGYDVLFSAFTNWCQSP